jgi:hypothetical protein
MTGIFVLFFLKKDRNGEVFFLLLFYYYCCYSKGLASSSVSSIYMMIVVLIGWNSMDVAKAAVAITSAITFGFFGKYLVEQVVELERCDKLS